MPKGRSSWTLAIALLAPLAAASGEAGAEGAVEIPRLQGRIVMDGVPDEEAWSRIAPLPMTQYAPTYRAAPSQRTEIRVAYDDESLYASGRFYDSEPAGVRVNSLYRDRWNGDDAFAIYVDAFNDNRNAKWFGTTPAGMRFDLLVSDDGDTLNESWDGFWDSKTSIGADGWFAEVRIPFSTLGFQAMDGRAVMGLTVTRLVSRLGERVTFPDIDPRFEFRQPSRAQDVVLTGVKTRRPVYLTPYVLAGGTRGAEPSREVGLDLRHAVSSTLTLDVTANTDFAQVEADDEQVALDRFPLFFPEKRRFFQEGSGLFDFATSGGGQLFHSRHIGLTEDRRPVPVLGGARLVGRVGEWDVGFLDMQTDALAGSPAENFGVVRLRRAALNPYSYVGVIGTSRVGGGRHNVALGADGLFRLFGDDYLGLKWAGTSDDEDTESADLASRSLFNARWERRTNRGLAYTFEAMRTGRDHRPELGFLPRADVTRATAVANWFLFTDDHPWLRRVYPGALAFATFRNGDRVLESGQYAAWVQWDTKAGGGGWIEPKVFTEDVREPFSIGGEAEIPAGRYTFADLQLVFSMPSGARLRTDVDFRAGTFFDGRRVQAIVTPTWNLSRHLELGGSYQLTRLRFEERAQQADIHLVSLQVRAALDARASANALVQYNSTTDRLDLNLRLRYNFAEGTDLWIVYNEGLVTDRAGEPGVPRLPLSAARGLIVKYSHTFGR
jgi:hypothetical protein